MFKSLKISVVLMICLFCTFEYAYAGSVTANISALNGETSTISPRTPSRSGYLSISLSGTWAGTMTVQRSFDSGVTWVDVISYTANTEKALREEEIGVLYKLKMTLYTSGTAIARLGTSED